MATKITEHFTLEELAATSHKDLMEKNLEYAKQNRGRVKFLCEQLEEVRKVLDCPIMVSSGVRCPELNKKVGGAATSQHTKCEAADIIPKKHTVPDAFCILFKSKIQYDQLILEQVGNKTWIHISFVPLPRKQALYYNGKKYITYTG